MIAIQDFRFSLFDRRSWKVAIASCGTALLANFLRTIILPIPMMDLVVSKPLKVWTAREDLETFI